MSKERLREVLSLTRVTKLMYNKRLGTQVLCSFFTTVLYGTPLSGNSHLPLLLVPAPQLLTIN